MYRRRRKRKALNCVDRQKRLSYSTNAWKRDVITLIPRGLGLAYIRWRRTKGMGPPSLGLASKGQFLRLASSLYSDILHPTTTRSIAFPVQNHSLVIEPGNLPLTKKTPNHLNSYIEAFSPPTWGWERAFHQRPSWLLRPGVPCQEQ